MDHVHIIKVTLSQLEELQAISKATFYETFSSLNTEENMKKYLDGQLSLERLSKELQDKNAEFYFAMVGNNIAGYLKLNSGQSQTELQDDKAIEIERIYVLKSFQGKNIGQLLYHKAEDIARKASADYIWLGVWEENSKAIRFYQKNGFVAFDKHIFILGNDEQTDIMMKLKLSYD